jgi:hypothetical protein
VPRVVDSAFAVAKTKLRPVYIEIAKDLRGMPRSVPGAPLDFSTLGQLAKQIVDDLRRASKPAPLLGIEVQRRAV